MTEPTEKPTNGEPTDHAVSIARITARQAVVVTTITAIAGLLGAAIQHTAASFSGSGELKAAQEKIASLEETIKTQKEQLKDGGTHSVPDGGNTSDKEEIPAAYREIENLTYLHITSVDVLDLGILATGDDEAQPKIRIIIHDHSVRQTHSYPKNAVWEPISENMRPSSFPVAGKVRVEAVLTVDGKREDRLNSNQLTTVALGAKGFQELFGGFMTRVRINFEGRIDP